MLLIALADGNFSHQTRLSTKRPLSAEWEQTSWGTEKHMNTSIGVGLPSAKKLHIINIDLSDYTCIINISWKWKQRKDHLHWRAKGGIKKRLSNLSGFFFISFECSDISKSKYFCNMIDLVVLMSSLRHIDISRQHSEMYSGFSDTMLELFVCVCCYKTVSSVAALYSATCPFWLRVPVLDHVPCLHNIYSQ